MCHLHIPIKGEKKLKTKVATENYQHVSIKLMKQLDIDVSPPAKRKICKGVLFENYVRGVYSLKKYKEEPEKVCLFTQNE